MNDQFASCLIAVNIKNGNASVTLYIHLLTYASENILKMKDN